MGMFLVRHGIMKCDKNVIFIRQPRALGPTPRKFEKTILQPTQTSKITPPQRWWRGKREGWKARKEEKGMVVD